MGESAKSALGLAVIVCVIVSALAWHHDMPDPTVWAIRIGSPIAVALCVAILIRFQFREDLAPDYLKQTAGNYFNRSGFCFKPSLTTINRRCWAVLWFENQFDRPCVGEVAIMPAQGFFLGRPDIPTITFRIECEPGAFGVARVPVFYPETLKGKPQKFDVGAASRFPKGRGKRLRFSDGITVGTNSNFGEPLRNTVMLLGAASGTLVLMRPASCTLQLPQGDLDLSQAALEPVVLTLWKLGDPPLELRADRSDFDAFQVARP